MLKNILYFITSILVFIAGVIVYGIILNINQVTLKEAMARKGIKQPLNTRIVVYRTGYRLDLYSDSVLIKSYRAVFGRNNSSSKKLKDQKITPTGRYFVCQMDTASRYRKFLRISYPNQKDMQEALKAGLITRQQYDSAAGDLNSLGYSLLPDKEIGIHGIGRLDYIFKNLPFVYNWTNGSVAVSNESIDEIYSVTKLGTEVVIKN